MKAELLACVMAVLAGGASAQDGAPEPGPNDAGGATADVEARYLELLDRASQLEAAGRADEARQLRILAEPQKQRLLERLEGLQAEVERLSRVTDAATEVFFLIRIMESSRARLRQSGFDLGLIDGPKAAPPRDGAATACRVLDSGSGVPAKLEALSKEGVLKVLAEPALAALSGRKTHYHSGGQFPLLVADAAGRSSIEYRNYGTEVDVTPVVLGDRTIRVQLRIAQSEIDRTRAIKHGDREVPALRVRNLETSAELQSDQYLLIGGLSQTRIETNEREPPLVGDVPGLGALLAKREERADDIEMLVLVEPYMPQGALRRRPPAQDGADLERRRLQGSWQVTSAAFQLAGPLYYRFTDDMLVVESWIVGKGEPQTPPTPSYARYRYVVKTRLEPKRLQFVPLDDDRAAPRQSLYEFRDGMLWMCPDDGAKGAASLRNGPGGDGWLMGLSRVETAIAPRR